MFLHLSVSHSVNRGGRGLCMMSLHVWLPGPIFLLEVESLSLAPCSLQVDLCLWSHVPSWGVSLIETPLNRDPLEKDAPGQRPPLDRDPPYRDWLMKLKSGLQW